MRPYAIAARRNQGFQTAYTAGLSYFPDGDLAVEPMGLYEELATVGAGVATGGVGGGVVAGVTTLVNAFTSGSKTDQERQARVNYFLQRAQQGNVAAAQLILGAPNNVSGNERSMWQQAAQILQSTPTGAAVWQAAQAAGPYWLVGSGDTATNYPAMKSFVNSWELTNNPGQYLPNVLPGAAPILAGASGALSSPLILGALALGAVMLLSKKR